MFYFFYKMIIFIVSKEKDDMRSAYCISHNSETVSFFIALWKHTCRPIKTHVLSKLFYKPILKVYNKTSMEHITKQILSIATNTWNGEAGSFIKFTQAGIFKNCRSDNWMNCYVYKYRFGSKVNEIIQSLMMLPLHANFSTFQTTSDRSLSSTHFAFPMPTP